MIQPINGDPFIGMLETPVTSSPIVAKYLSNLPAYRTGVSPLLRGVEIGLAHGFLLVGPFIKVRCLRLEATSGQFSQHTPLVDSLANNKYTDFPWNLYRASVLQVKRNFILQQCMHAAA